VNIFYQDDIKDLPLDYIESVLLADEFLKKKYELNDFMTSLVIWRGLLNTSANRHQPKFPIPPCNILVPLDYSTWNSSKGGSNTATRYTYNCKIIAPHKVPQEKMVARLLSLSHVVFLRCAHAVTGKKVPDPLTDTVRTIRNRNNQRITLHDSLRYVANRFLNIANARENNAAALASSTNHPSFIVEPAERFRKANEHTRCDKDNSLLGAVKITDAVHQEEGEKPNIQKCVLRNTTHLMSVQRIASWFGCTKDFFLMPAADIQGMTLQEVSATSVSKMKLCSSVFYANTLSALIKTAQRSWRQC
jgi:hypothetical protein